ncbi:MAG: hypothetical protein BroJett040_15030 [Oligoflexia bacterium]|nr:MAG: hypothetical protein BroJett040_15030 [Oligoflexia bacterium]
MSSLKNHIDARLATRLGSLVGGIFLVSNLISCSKASAPKEFIWQVGGSQSLPGLIHGEQFKQQEISLLTNNELVERSPQMVGPAEVEGGFVQKLYNSKGSLIFARGQYIDEDYSKLRTLIEKRNTEKFAFLQKFKGKDASLKNAQQIFDPKVAIHQTAAGAQIIYNIDYIDHAGTGVYRMKVSPNSGVISQERTSSGFDQGKATVFPSGPKMSELSEVMLGGLIGDGTLTKQNLKVISQAAEKAQNPNLVFNYDPADGRFDQVQAFYFVDRTLGLFISKLGISLPFSLEVQTQYGAPDKTNAAFYYHGQIRLGTGDGVNYANMMKDPTIVMHETCHALIDGISRLPNEGEGGSLNEAFADFFTTTFMNHPHLGEVSYLKGPFKRTVDNSLKLSDRKGTLYFDSTIVSGTLWEIKELIGERQGLILATKTLSRLGPSGKFSTFVQSVESAMANGFTDEEKQNIRDVLKKRQWL